MLKPQTTTRLLSISFWAPIQSRTDDHCLSGDVGSRAAAGESPVPGISTTAVATPLAAKPGCQMASSVR